MKEQVEQFHQFEMELTGPSTGNPFCDVDLSCEFENGEFKARVRGFYDGNGSYKVRYMPEKLGEWEVTTISNIDELDNKKSNFICTPASKTNHGPVRVAGKTHFQYADGSPYLPFGTTAYAWTNQSAELQDQTLKTLEENSFNKIRMTIFPKYYNYNTEEPDIYPYVGAPKNPNGIFNDDSWKIKPEDIGFDFSKFNPVYFQNLDRRIKELDEIGVQADLILFHPYDSWGFARMGRKFDILYLKYVIARFSSFKNVWWSLANEYDLMDSVGQKNYEDWDVIGETVHDEDPSSHLLSIHNFYDPPVHKGTRENWYDYSKNWITHLSIQSDNVFFTPEWMEEYKKPVVFDECRYEGNIELGFGDNSAQGMLDNFYRIVLRGGYATHGETYIDKPYTKRPIWWAHGGVLRGESPKRISFLFSLLEENEFDYVVPLATEGPHWELAVGSSPDGKHILAYMGENTPEFEIFDFLPDDSAYDAKLIDTWNMEIKDMPEVITSKNYFHIPLRTAQAVLLTKKVK